MDISYTYLYELVKFDDESIFYVGKTNNPPSRLSHHRSSSKFFGMNFYLRIVDRYVDSEDILINKYINEGHKLQNIRKNNYIKQEYNIGDKIKFDHYNVVNKIF
jgi:predicted GIY-YIG superfamily endonuclease